MDITTNTPATDKSIADEARDLSDYMRQPQPETETRRQAREASMRSMATRLMTGGQDA
jgi:hypothetical protein